MKKAVIFCAGKCFLSHLEKLQEYFEIIVLADNDPQKWNKRFGGYKCVPPEEALMYKVDIVIIATNNLNIITDITQQIKIIVPSMKVLCIEDVIANNYERFHSNYETNYIDRFDNHIQIAEGVIFNHIQLYFLGNNNKVIIEKNVVIQNDLHGYIGGNNNYLEIGKKTTIVSLYIDMSEHGKILIGDDCMISSDVEIYQNATHPIFDQKSGKRLNYSRDIIIGSHVWIGKRVGLMTGFCIGNNSIIGYGSVSSGSFGSNVTVAGAPAKVIREGIQWTCDGLGNYALNHIQDSRFPYIENED